VLVERERKKSTVRSSLQDIEWGSMKSPRSNLTTPTNASQQPAVVPSAQNVNNDYEEDRYIQEENEKIESEKRERELRYEEEERRIEEEERMKFEEEQKYVEIIFILRKHHSHVSCLIHRENK
jgi:hypothetical protein